MRMRCWSPSKPMEMWMSLLILELFEWCLIVYTFLNVSRLHGIVPKQLMLTGFWAWMRMIGRIFWKFIGNEYHSYWFIVSLIASNWIDILPQVSHVTKIKMNDAINSRLAIIIIAKFHDPFDWISTKNKIKFKNHIFK